MPNFDPKRVAIIRIGQTRCMVCGFLFSSRPSKKCYNISHILFFNDRLGYQKKYYSTFRFGKAISSTFGVNSGICNVLRKVEPDLFNDNFLRKIRRLGLDKNGDIVHFADDKFRCALRRAMK